MFVSKFVNSLVAAGAMAFAAVPAVADGYARRSTAEFGPPPFSWTGVYVGVHAGGAWGSATSVSSACSPFPACDQLAGFGSLNGSGFAGGLQAGINWQINTVVLGVEADFTWTGIDGSAADVNRSAAGAILTPGGHSWSRDVDWLASLRARAGITLTPTMLAYITGGVAWQGVDLTAVQAFTNSTAAVSVSDTKTGYVIGGGLELALNSNWLLRGEYLYYSFDGGNAAVVHSAFPAITANFAWGDSQIHSLRAALSYKF